MNYPSLWSGGVEWNAADIGDGTQAYWQSSANATARTGKPDIGIAVGGDPVTNTIRSASWQLGRSEWLSVLTPGSASFEVEGAVTFDPMDEVVIGVMSDTTTEHSDPLWVGYVDSIRATTETSGRIVTSVSCVDSVGRLGQAVAPASFPDALFPNSGIAPSIELAAAEVGLSVDVVDDSVFAQDDPTIYQPQAGETMLEWLNRMEAADNFNLFGRGDGRLVVQRRWYVSAPDLDPAPTPVALTGGDTPSTWTVERSPTSVVNDFGEDWATTAAMETSQARYGKRSYVPPSVDANNYDLLIASGVMNDPRPVLSSADLPITDLGDAVLFLDPNDWVTLDSETYQVLSIQHSVEPGHRWRVSVTGDTTQVALHEAFA